MRAFILLALLAFSTPHVHAKCTICSSSDELVTRWKDADTKEKRGEVMRDSYRLLETMVPLFEAQAGDLNRDDVAAATRVIGALYGQSYDPRRDVLRLYRRLLKTPTFHRDFESELKKLPPEEGDSVRRGLRDLAQFD